MVAVKIPKKGELPPLPQNYAIAPSKFRRPPLDGTMSVAEMCDWDAEHSPEQPLFEYLDGDGQVANVKWKDAGSAMHRGGWLIKSALEKHVPVQGRRVVIAVVANSGMFICRQYDALCLTILHHRKCGVCVNLPRHTTLGAHHLSHFDA